MPINTEPTLDVHPDDQDLIEQLARVQNTHNQIRELRDLLPGTLLAPARQAISKNSQIGPKDVAISISRAAQKGRDDFQTLKKGWHDEKMKQLLREAHSAEFIQGTDAWLIDYQSLIKMDNASSRRPDHTESISFDTIQEAKTISEKYLGDARQLKLQTDTSDAQNPFPLQAMIGRLRFQILRTQSQYDVQPVEHHKLAHQISEQVKGNDSPRRLETILQNLEAYHDVRTRKCDTCSSLLDSNLDYPFVRTREHTPSNEGTAQGWLAYHKTCIP